MSELRVGTSGWHYPHWRERFYPRGLAPGEWLRHYAGAFDTVELNNSFYRLPSESAFLSWREQTPPGFLFAVKASRYITHMKRLLDAGPALDELMRHAERLGDKLGPVLFQLPPHMSYDPERLEAFLSLLPRGHRFAFEFRDPAWLDAATYSLLREHGCALCVADSPRLPAVKETTADFVFLRFHGGRACADSLYTGEELDGWARTARAWLKKGFDVYAYFNNDAYGYALSNAEYFRKKATLEAPAAHRRAEKPR